MNRATRLSVLKSYLSILQAGSLAEVQARVVSTVRDELKKQGVECALPIRLSRVAERFQILPQVGELRLPGFGCRQAEQLGLAFDEALRAGAATGYEDGSIEYLEEAKGFLVRLRGLGDRARLRRLRFTYAHELAHRFFFAKVGASWVRALDLATRALPGEVVIPAKLYLVKLEECQCNAIARRLLMPGQLVEALCNLEAWFGRGEGMYGELMRAAGTFGVSPVTLLVRLREVPVRQSDFSGAVFVVRPLPGRAGEWGHGAPRVITALVPVSVAPWSAQWYPGLEVVKLGPEFARFVQNALSCRVPGGTLAIQLCSGSQPFARLVGWWRKLASESTWLPPALIVWGRLE